MSDEDRTRALQPLPTGVSPEPCNHRGFRREFVRSVSGVIMLCEGCGAPVVPASRRPIAA